jgi:hypothetical protein
MPTVVSTLDFHGQMPLAVALPDGCSSGRHPLSGRAIDLFQLRRHRYILTLSQDIHWWRGLDSNQRRRTPADLQSAPFSHSGTPPRWEPGD